jgi:hypothetical protein
MPISTMHFVGFCFHSCFMMTVDNQDLFMNGVREDGEGEGFPLFVSNYGVGIGEAQGFGNGDGGQGFEASLNEVNY